jgi:hypothetical protein
MKNKQIVLLLTVFFLIVGCNTVKGRLDREPTVEWIPFDWYSETIGDRDFEKAAMIVPVAVDGLPQKFTMQFDLGAAYHLFHGNTIAPFVERYPSLAEKLSTNEGVPWFFGISLGLGPVVFDDADIWVMTDYGAVLTADEIDANEEIHIGSIGLIIAWNKILILDFPNQRFSITEQMPREYQSLPAVDCEIRDFDEPYGGHVFFSFDINGKKELVVFDTGSSIFSLLTTKEKALSIASPDVADIITIPAFGKEIAMHGHEIVKDVYFEGKNLKGELVYYDISGSSDGNFTEGAWGITGNRLFLENVVILDYPNKTVRIK